jgi:hypothetical protein
MALGELDCDVISVPQQFTGQSEHVPALSVAAIDLPLANSAPSHPTGNPWPSKQHQRH